MKPPVSALPPTPDSIVSAKEAGLRYVSDAKPGWRRQKKGASFSFISADGKRITNPEDLRRIKSLVIPPAWRDVWICPFAHGHLQATGRDARGRKQYRYHARWREVRDESKYDRVMEFGKALPVIRRRVAKDLKLEGLPRNKVLATVVRLLETTLIRIGNEEYAKTNASYGLTTMHNRHAAVRGETVTFTFRGKSGKRHQIDLHDARIARMVKRCQHLPGQELFGYIDENGEPRDVTSADVNDYLQEIAGSEFTAKDFRTWTGTILAAMALREFEQFKNASQAKRNIVKAIEAVAQMLGNTPTVCRKCYIHPTILDSYLDGSLLDTIGQRADEKISRSLARLKPEEAAVMVLLKKRIAATKRQIAKG